MKKNEWITIIILMIVIATVVAYITGSITGNVIKLNEDKWGKYQGYTTAEVDAKISGLAKPNPTLLRFEIFTDTGSGIPAVKITDYTPGNSSNRGQVICMGKKAGESCYIGNYELAIVSVSSNRSAGVDSIGINLVSNNGYIVPASPGKMQMDFNLNTNQFTYNAGSRYLMIYPA